MRTLLTLFCIGLIAAAACAAPSGRVYVTSFQRGELIAMDVATGKIVYRIAVEDKAGITGFDTSPDGRTLYVLDGGTQSRLRIINAATGEVQHTTTFANRALMLGGYPVLHATRDGKSLLMPTYDYEAAASGMRRFMVESRSWFPVGVRYRPEGTSRFLSTRDGSVFAVSSKELTLLRGMAGDLLPAGTVKLPDIPLADIQVAPDGRSVAFIEFRSMGASTWRIGTWNPATKQLKVVDLARRLAVPEDQNGGSASLTFTDDGRTIVVLRGRDVLFIDTQKLALKKRIALETEADVLLSSGLQVIAMTHDGKLRLVSPAGVKALADIGLKPSGPPLQAILAPAP